MGGVASPRDPACLAGWYGQCRDCPEVSSRDMEEGRSVQEYPFRGVGPSDSHGIPHHSSRTADDGLSCTRRPSFSARVLFGGIENGRVLPCTSTRMSTIKRADERMQTKQSAFLTGPRKTPSSPFTGMQWCSPRRLLRAVIFL